MAQSGQSTNPAERSLNDLRNKNEEVKARAASELRETVDQLYRGKQGDQSCYIMLIHPQNGLLRDLANSSTP